MKKAFTLVEMLVVIGIIGILAAVLLGTFSGSTESAKTTLCMSNMRALGSAVHACAAKTSDGSGGYYPAAGSYQYKNYSASARKVITTWHPGWLDSVCSPYDASDQQRRICSTNGVLWAALNGVNTPLVCPYHRKCCQAAQKGDPLYSYAMNSYFGWDRGGKVLTSWPQRSFPLNRADRVLLFAELPYASAKVPGGNEFQKEDYTGNRYSSVLQYDSDNIGFNHKDGKNPIGLVCFADGHVEKLRVPKEFSESDVRQLTEWLCCPWDDNNVPFDVIFTNTGYEQKQ